MIATTPSSRTTGGTRYESLVTSIMFFTWGAVFLDRMSLLYLAPAIAGDLHLTEEDIGFLASATAITWAASSLGFGVLSDFIGRRRVLIPLVFLFSVLSWLSGIARNFGQMFAIRAMMGVAEGPCWSVINAIVEESSSPARRGRNIGIVVSAAAAIGLAAAPVLTTQIASHYGWRAAFFVAGIPGIAMGLLIMKFVREPARAPIDPAAPRIVPKRLSTREYIELFRSRNILLCCIGAAGFMAWLYLQNVFAPLYITRVAHQLPTTAGFLLGAAGLGSFIICLIAPSLSDRVGRRKTLLLTAGLSMLLPLALLVQPLYDHPWILAAILFLTQGGQAIAALVIVLVPTDAVPQRFAGSAIGLVTLIGEVFGGTAAPAIGGRLATDHGLEAPLLMAAGAMFVVFIVGLLLRDQEPRAV